MTKNEASDRLYDALISAVSTLDGFMWDLPSRQRERIRSEIDYANRAIQNYRDASK